MKTLKYKNIEFSITSGGSICWMRGWSNVELLKANSLIADLSEYFTDQELDAPGHMYQDCGPFIKKSVLENVRLQEAVVRQISDARSDLRSIIALDCPSSLRDQRLALIIFSRSRIKDLHEKLRLYEDAFGVSIKPKSEIKRELEEIKRRQADWASSCSS